MEADTANVCSPIPLKSVQRQKNLTWHFALFPSLLKCDILLEKTEVIADILEFISFTGSNILLARMATRKAKPDGHYHLKPEEVDDFIRGQLVTSLPGTPSF